MKNAFKTIAILLLLVINTQQLQAQNEALKILPNGNVGVGIANPTEKLHVEGRIKDKTGFIMPVGTVLPFAGKIVPEGWLLCNGASYSNTGDKKDLYNVIGITYGRATGKFKVPDLRSTFIMGSSNHIAESVGKKGTPDTHNHRVSPVAKDFTTDKTGSHRHKFPSNWYKRDVDTGSKSGIDTGGSNVKSQRTQSSGNHSHTVSVALPAFNSGPSSGANRPKWVALNYIIKY